MKKAVSQDQAVDALGLPLKLERINLRVQKEKLESWKAASRRASLKLAEWIRQALDEKVASLRNRS